MSALGAQGSGFGVRAGGQGLGRAFGVSRLEVEVFRV